MTQYETQTVYDIIVNTRSIIASIHNIKDVPQSMKMASTHANNSLLILEAEFLKILENK